MESPDRCGKDTQIKLIKNRFPYFLFHELHYTADLVNNPNLSIEEKFKISKNYYIEMFDIISSFSCYKNFILNRAHLGEYVYGKKYRGYDGSYVFDLEKKYKDFLYQMKLIVFIDSAHNLISREDGESLSGINIENKQEEIDKFIAAYEYSIIPKKKLINIDGKSIEQVCYEIFEFLFFNKEK